jgi:hypothetical protein
MEMWQRLESLKISEDFVFLGRVTRIKSKVMLVKTSEDRLIQHSEELRTFISLHNIDVMLISETHFKEKSYLKLLNYTVYHIDHPVGTARGGTAIIVKPPYNIIK